MLQQGRKGLSKQVKIAIRDLFLFFFFFFLIFFYCIYYLFILFLVSADSGFVFFFFSVNDCPVDEDQEFGLE